MEEPSVLDYVKERLKFWNKPTPAELDDPSAQPEQVIQATDEQAAELDPSAEHLLAESEQIAPARASLPWRSFLALGLALVAQATLQPGPERSWLPGALIYLASAACLVWSVRLGEWSLAPLPEEEPHIDPFTVRWIPAVAGLVSAGLLFLASGGNRFTLLNMLLLLLSLGLLAWAFWPPCASGDMENPGMEKTRRIRMDRWAWFVLALLAAAVLIRFWQFNSLPAEMTSDHAEKIMDVMRVLSGDTRIFFPTNGGREALHFYLLASLHKFLGVELGFGLLKLSTILVGLFALPFIYLLGKEIANRRVGWLAVAFATISYWPYIISRVGLRFPFFVLFTAVLLLFLLKGIRTQSRIAMILAGVSLGLSFYGYSADRILPLLVLAAVGLYLLHRQSSGQRRQTVWLSVVLVLFSIIVALPLMRYMIDDPGNFLQRTVTRISGVEQPLAAPAWQIFLSNTGRALAMPFWDDGEVWLASIPHRPALEIVTAALFFCGLLLVLIRYLRNRHWLDIFLLISIPILMLPSIMALAFPNENPNLYRTGGAIVPVFLLIGLALDGLMSGLQVRVTPARSNLAAWGVAAVLLFLTAVQSYNLVFDQYQAQYRLSAWNTSEMGRVMRNFADLTGTTDNAWVIPYPYWVDTRLVGMNAGFPWKDYALVTEQLETTRTVTGSKLFLLKPEDTLAIETLGRIYPQGWFQEFQSAVPSKNFLVFQVPPLELPLEPEIPTAPPN